MANAATFQVTCATFRECSTFEKANRMGKLSSSLAYLLVFCAQLSDDLQFCYSINGISSGNMNAKPKSFGQPPKSHAGITFQNQDLTPRTAVTSDVTSTGRNPCFSLFNMASPKHSACLLSLLSSFYIKVFPCK